MLPSPEGCSEPPGSPQNSGLDILLEGLKLLWEQANHVCLHSSGLCLLSSWHAFKWRGVLGPLHSPHCPGSDLILYNQSIPRTLFMIWGPHLVPSTGIQSPSREVLLVLTHTRADLSQRVGANSLCGWYNTCRGMGKWEKGTAAKKGVLAIVLWAPGAWFYGGNSGRQWMAQKHSLCWGNCSQGGYF